MATKTLQVKITGDSKDAQRAFDQLNRSASDTESHMGRVGAAIGKLALGVGVAVGLAGTAIAGWGLKSAADMQQVEIAFQGILGSAEKSQAFLTEMKNFAAKTPFEFPELARAAKMLLATGTAAEDVIPTMTKLGNVAAVLGVGGAEIEGVVRALGQMKGKGKASAEELQQISEQIPGFSAIKAIAEGMGITVEEAFDKMADGAIPADEAIAHILAGMERFPGAAGAMERQSMTLNGVLSTLKDTVQQGLVEGLAPVLPVLAGALNAAAPVISQVVGTIGQTFANLFARAVPLFEKLLPIIGTLADMLAGVLGAAFTALTPVIEKLAPVFADILQSLGGAFIKIITALAPILVKVADAFAEIWTTLKDSGLLDRLVQLFVKLLTALGPVIEQLGKAFVKALVALMPSLIPLIDAMLKLFDALLPLFPLFVRFSTILLELIPILEPVIRLLADVLVGAIGAVTDAINWLRDNWRPAWETIKQIANDAYNGVIKPIFEGIQWVIDNIVLPAVNRLKGIWDGIFQGVEWAWNNIGSPVLSSILGILNGIINAIQWIRNNFTALFGGGDLNDYLTSQQRAANRLGSAPSFTAPGAYEGYAGAEGAIVNQPTLALIGEAGPEMLVPLSSAPGASSLPGWGSQTIVLQIDGKTVTEVVVSNLNRSGGPRISQRAIA